MTTASKPEVNKATGEIKTTPVRRTAPKPPTNLPVAMSLGSQLSVMSPEVAAQAVEYLQEIKKSILRAGVDYGVIPGTGNKPTLFKPGAQKLVTFFNLTAHYQEVAELEQDFLREWQYEYYDKYKKKSVTKKVVGVFAYRVRCELLHRETGVTWGTGYGICSNTEKGRQANDANIVVKMAQKRAMLQATLDATFSSELFTQDMEDYRSAPPEGADKPAQGAQGAPASSSPSSEPTPKRASEKQLNFAKVLIRKKELPRPLSISAENFCNKPELQTMANASALIEKLNKCKDKVEAGRGSHEERESQAPPDEDPGSAAYEGEEAPPNPVDPPSSEGAIPGYMRMLKGDIVDLIGHEAARLWNSVKEEATFYELSRSAGRLTSTTLDTNTRGQLARLLDHMTNLKKGETK